MTGIAAGTVERTLDVVNARLDPASSYRPPLVGDQPPLPLCCCTGPCDCGATDGQ